MIEQYFINNELPENLSIQSVLLKFEIEILNVSISRLIIFLVKLFEKRMLEGLLSTQSLCRIIAKQLAHQIQGIFLNTWEQPFESHFFCFSRAFIQEVTHTHVFDLINQMLRWETEKCNESLDLFCKVFLSKNDFSEIELRKDTAG